MVYEDIAKAETDHSLFDLFCLAWKYWWMDERAGSHPRTPSPSLAAVNDAIVRLMAQIGNDVRYPRGVHDSPLLFRRTSEGEFVDDLALALEMPDAPELRDGVDAMMRSLCSRGSEGKGVLYAKACRSSEMMRVRAAQVLEQAGDRKAAERLRRSVREGSHP